MPTIINNITELKSLLNKDNDLIIDDDVIIKFDIESGIVRNINCRNIDCMNIDCENINCLNIRCGNITCVDIKCKKLSYHAFCFAYNSIECESWIARRENAPPPFCVDGKLTITKEKKL